jgi:hypothetical protein
MIKNLTYLGAFTLFVVIVWVALTVYTNFIVTTIPKNIDEQIKPLDDSFNVKVLENLKKRNNIQANLSELLPEPSITSQVSQVTVISAPVTPSPSISILPSPQSSSPGQTLEEGL